MGRCAVWAGKAARGTAAALGSFARLQHRRTRKNVTMVSVLALTAHTGRDLAEVGFLLMVIAGVWLAATQLPQPSWKALRTIVAGILIAVGGVLLIIATHWGHFG